MKIDRKFIERLATYLIGVAIGLLILGFVQMQRSKARQAANPPAPQSAPGPQTTGESGSPRPTDP